MLAGNLGIDGSFHSLHFASPALLDRASSSYFCAVASAKLSEHTFTQGTVGQTDRQSRSPSADSTFSRAGAALPGRVTGFLHTRSHCLLFLWDKLIFFYTRLISLPSFENVASSVCHKIHAFDSFYGIFLEKEKQSYDLRIKLYIFHTTHDLHEY